MSRFFKKKNEFSKVIVILDIVIFLLYVIINIIMMWIKETAMPTDINAGVFAFLTGELGLLSFIKRSKLTTGAVKNTVENIATVVEKQQQQDSNLQQQLQNNNIQQGAG
jgi:hypothetical protein